MALWESNTLIYVLAAVLAGCILGWILHASIVRKRQKNLHAHIALLKKALKQARRQAQSSFPVVTEEHVPFQGRSELLEERRNHDSLNKDMLDELSIDSAALDDEGEHVDILDAFIGNSEHGSEQLLDIPPSSIMEDYRSRNEISDGSATSLDISENPQADDLNNQSGDTNEPLFELNDGLRFGGLDMTNNVEGHDCLDDSLYAEDVPTEDNIVLPFIAQKVAGDDVVTEYQSANLLDDSPTEFGIRVLAAEASEQLRWSKEGQRDHLQLQQKKPIIFDDDLTVVSTPKVISRAAKLNPIGSLAEVENKRQNIDVSASFVDYELSHLGDIPTSNLGHLADIGIESSQQLLRHCRTENELLAFAKANFIPLRQLRQWMTRCDLLRVSGLGLTHSSHLLNAGVHSVEQLTSIDLEELRLKLDAQMQASGYEESQLTIWQDNAKVLLNN